LWSGGSAEGLVVPVGIEGEVAEELAGGGVDDAHVQVGIHSRSLPCLSMM
jgi:hypothetical protein